MTDTEKITMIGNMTGETDRAVLSTYLEIAKGKVLQRAYPYGNPSDKVPDKYAITQVEIAVYMLNKRGAEGETAHSENGISRSYESGDIPANLLRSITPMVGVFG